MLNQRLQEEVLSKFGVELANITFDSKVHRNKDVWYVGHTWEFKKKEYSKVTYGSWKTSEQETISSYDGEKTTKSFKNSERKQTDEMNAKLAIEKVEKHKTCRDKWKPIFDKARANQKHEYLEFKGVPKSYNTRVDHNGVLLIPIYNINGFVGVQRIYRNEEGKWEKRFSAGIDVRGSFNPLKPFKESPLIYICEGYATASSIQSAFPDVPVICVFNAGNLIPAINSIRNINPKCNICIGADFDQNKYKTGQRKAKQASLSLPRVVYRIPKFSTANPQWTDWNDLHQFESLDSVKDQMQIDSYDFAWVKPLGMRGDKFFYTSSMNKQVIALSSSSHRDHNFRGIITDEYWIKHFPKMDEEENIKGVQWDNVENFLKKSCMDLGIFDPSIIRGKGVWIDDNRIVVNTGEYKWVDGERVSEVSDTKYFYQATDRFNYDPTDIIKEEERVKIIQFFKNLRYKNKNDYIYLVSWIVQAQIFATLDWRPHIWLSGERGSGKSTILKWVNELIFNSTLEEDSSSAGIRQYIENNAMPVIYDETEPDNDRLKSVIAMARQSSSNNESNTRRGTVGGAALSYNTQTCFLMGSIQKSGMTQADVSRFYIIDMLSTKGQNQEDYKELLNFVDHIKKTKLVNRLFSYVVSDAKNILDNIQKVRVTIKGRDIEARLADQFSVTIACFFSILEGGEIKESDIDYILGVMAIDKTDYIEDNKVSDAEECLDAILSLKIDNQNTTVLYAIEAERTFNKSKGHWGKELGSFGIRHDVEGNKIFIANTSRALSMALSKVSNFTDYSSLLKRLDGAVREQKRISGFGNQRGVTITLKGR